ncbi:unnamed protein product [Rhizophagus irregularis]|nr:unnamed protein product [Rhizophagus irregularis]CAB5378911.1 unnamed protein product [Rhizophagus irregularis]
MRSLTYPIFLILNNLKSDTKVLYAPFTIRATAQHLLLVKSSRPISHTLGYDGRLVMNRLGEFYLCIPRPLNYGPKNQGPFIVNEEQRRTRLISLDPGVRTFMTCYSPDGYTARIA